MLSHRRRVAAPVDGFVGFAIGRSIREDATAAHRRGELDDASTGTVILQENLRYADLYRTSDPELLQWDLLHAHQAPSSRPARAAHRSCAQSQQRAAISDPGRWQHRTHRSHPAPGPCGIGACGDLRDYRRL